MFARALRNSSKSLFESRSNCSRENVSEKLASWTYLILMPIFVFKGTQINQVPIVMRQPLDLFRFFTVVQERGGLQEVSSVKTKAVFFCFTTALLVVNCFVT